MFIIYIDNIYIECSRSGDYSFILLTGFGLKSTLKRKFQEAGVTLDDGESVINKMTKQLLSSRANGTVAKYSYAVKAFQAFCDSRNFKHTPAHSVHLAIYLSHLIDEGKSDKIVSAAFYAIKWLHQLHDLPDPTSDRLCINLLESAKRLNSKPIVKKDVVLTDHLIKLCNMFKDSHDVIVLRDLAMILLGYAGFLRFNELSELKCLDVKFQCDHMVLRIRSSKTDVYRSGKDVFISKGVTVACPFVMLQKYMHISNLMSTPESYLFKPAFRSKSKSALIAKNKKLSYTRTRECILSRLKLVAPHLRLGIHSLRASGASVAANAEGVTDRCLKRHGRWKSETAKDGYIEDSLEKKLFITKQLKL